MTCKENGKVYVGQTIATRGIRRRWQGHISAAEKSTSKALYAAMRKHGKDNFDVQEIGQARDKASLDNLEAVCVILFNSMNPDFGYNRRAGGVSSTFSEETRKLMSAARKKRVTKPETRIKISLAMKLRPPMKQETREKLRKRMLGNSLGAFKRSEETRKKMGPKTPENIAKVTANLAKGRKVWSEGDPREKNGQFVKGSRYTKHA